MQKKILITGGTGFIGSYLVRELINEHDITILTRNPDKHRDRLSRNISGKKLQLISNLNDLPFEYDIIINLAGHPIACNWNNKIKKLIYDSRIDTTRTLTEAVLNANTKPELFISGSAIGYYGSYASGPDNGLSEEDSAGNHNSFPVKLCLDWENATSALEGSGIRTCILRTGLVLAKDGGVLAKMIPSFRLFLGAIIANGTQYMSWIHIQDVINIIKFIIENKELNGAINLTAPCPVNNSEFTTSLADAMFRPVFIRIPAFVFRAILGQMGNELLIKGQKVFPKKLLDNGYKFSFKTIHDALKNII